MDRSESNIHRPADSHGDWVLCRPDEESHSPPLYLQPRLANQLRIEQRQRQKERYELERAQLTEANLARKQETVEKAPTQSRTAAALGQHYAHPYEALRHAVLPNPDRVLERLERVRDGMFGDKEHTAREVKALGAALERGPDRSIVRPPRWQQALDDLSTELPGFRDAIACVRHALALSEATLAPPSLSPLLLLGPPGVGKSYFCRRLAEVLACRSGWLGMDQPTAGCDLRGTDSHWSTARHGLLFELLALGDTANPIVVLDELDKSSRRHSSQGIDQLAQLYSALERETARHLADVSLGVELDASQVVYVATANSLRAIDAALLSRFEVFPVLFPSVGERREAAARIVASSFEKLGVRGLVSMSPGCFVVLAEYSPRLIQRAVQGAVGKAVANGAKRIGIEDVEAALRLGTEAKLAKALH